MLTSEGRSVAQARYTRSDKNHRKRLAGDAYVQRGFIQLVTKTAVFPLCAVSTYGGDWIHRGSCSGLCSLSTSPRVSADNSSGLFRRPIPFCRQLLRSLPADLCACRPAAGTLVDSSAVAYAGNWPPTFKWHQKCRGKHNLSKEVS